MLLENLITISKINSQFKSGDVNPEKLKKTVSDPEIVFRKPPIRNLLYILGVYFLHPLGS
jgi:hypothetical protein